MVQQLHHQRHGPVPVQQLQEHLVADQTIPKLPEVAIVQALLSQTLLAEPVRRCQELVHEFQGDGVGDDEESVALEGVPLFLGEGSELHGSGRRGGVLPFELFQSAKTVANVLIEPLVPPPGSLPAASRILC